MTNPAQPSFQRLLLQQLLPPVLLLPPALAFVRIRLQSQRVVGSMGATAIVVTCLVLALVAVVYRASRVLKSADEERARSQRELEAAVQARDDLLSVATHELKSPIASIQLKLQLLQRLAGKSPQLASTDVLSGIQPALNQLTRLTKLIDNLLDVARIRNHQLTLDIDALDLSRLVSDVIDRMKDVAQARGTSLRLNAPSPVIGYWDPSRLEQVFVNLVTNAIKYGEGRPIDILVQGDEETARVEVRDFGIGIAPEHHERIFERFERRTEKHQQQSLGLGLYIVRELVHAHGGKIDVQSSLGRGSVFSVALPSKRIAPGASASEISPEEVRKV